MVTKMKATPSMPRDTMSIMPSLENAPISEPITITTAAMTSTFFGPIFLARAPVGSASTMPANVKIDISHDELPESMPNISMRLDMITGTLYCVDAMAVPNSSRHTAMSIQLP